MNVAFFNDSSVTRIDTVQYQTNDRRTLTFQIKRDDLIDFSISGNKWRKLKYNFFHAQKSGYSGIASFGGAFSNHISALAAAGHKSNMKTIGFIRTHSIDALNPTLFAAQKCGMKLVPLSREQYRQRHDDAFLDTLKKDYPSYYFVPEGGSNNFAHQGVAELANELSTQTDFKFVAVPLGSGGTASGLAKHLPSHNIIAVAAVNDPSLFD